MPEEHSYGTEDSPVEGFLLLDFKPDALAAKRLPGCKYPIPLDALDDVLTSGGGIPNEQLLVWMQEYVEPSRAPWEDYEAPMLELAATCAPDDPRNEISAESEQWSLVCGMAELDEKLVSFCRQGKLLAVAQRNSDGRLRVTSYRPLDARTCRTILGCSRRPGPDGTVCMRPDNWEYLGDNACGSGQLYAHGDGRSYMALWEYGLGVTSAGDRDPDFYPLRSAAPLPAAMLATQLGLNYELSSRE